MTTGDIIGLSFFIFLFIVATGFGIWLQRAENERLEKLDKEKS